MLAIIETATVAQNGWGNHMWGWASSGGWWMGLAMVAFWTVVVLIVVMLTRSGDTHPSQPAPDPHERARAVLAERLARGEIEPAEYRDRLDPLS